MSSYSSPLPPYVTPGWNDPPANTSSDRKKPSFSLHRHRRPLDPSIQESAGQSPTPPLAHSHTHALNGHASHPNAASQLGFADSGVYSRGMDGAHGGVEGTPPTTRTFPNSQHRAVYDAFTVAPAGAPQDPFEFARINPHTTSEGLAPGQCRNTIPFQQNFTSENSVPPVSHASCIPSARYSPPVPGPPIESNPNALIYTPPNAIGEMNQRPSTSPDPASYVAPMKAAGDVSLSGVQLVQFITKATLRLPPGVTRDGIQLRIAHFNDLVSVNAVSEGLVKKLNFVVDAMDRGLYDEALQFFEQMQCAFVEETKTSWAQGLRLLICELKRPARSGSAGMMRH